MLVASKILYVAVECHFVQPLDLNFHQKCIAKSLFFVTKWVATRIWGHESPPFHFHILWSYNMLSSCMLCCSGDPPLGRASVDPPPSECLNPMGFRHSNNTT